MLLQEKKSDKENSYTKAEIDSKLTAVYRAKGNVATYADLPVESTIWWVYNVLDTGKNYVWVGISEEHFDGWDELSGVVDLSEYLKIADTLVSQKYDSEAEAQAASLANPFICFYPAG